MKSLWDTASGVPRLKGLGSLPAALVFALAVVFLCIMPSGAPAAAVATAAKSTTPIQLAQSSARQRAISRGGVPAEYLGRESRLPKAKIVTRVGGELYAVNCARCHGADGRGDGSDGAAIMPPPAVLAYTVKSPRAGDDYLLWTISDGGAEFGTAMPAFKGPLTTREIWKIIEFMRAGFPAPEPAER